VRAALALVALLLAVVPASAQQREATPPPAGEAKPIGYLPADAVDYRLVLPAPPAPGSLRDRLDLAEVLALQTGADADRWKTANQDDAYVYPRFDEAFGGPIDRAHAPKLVALLNRVIRDVAAPTFAAKQVYLRARPYQRVQLARVCGEDPAPAPEPDPKERSSYPSGHSAYGWITALVLARVAPDRAPQLLARAADYALSREICGVHFPSDVEAGRVMAVAVIDRLTQDPAFQADLAAAKAEYAARR
jgi:acid phosphatase (class A)